MDMRRNTRSLLMVLGVRVTKGLVLPLGSQKDHWEASRDWGLSMGGGEKTSGQA